MLEGKDVGERVVVYDCEGYFMGVGLAERLARNGKHVIYVTPGSHPGAYMHYTGEMARLHRVLHDVGVGIVAERVLDSVDATGVRAASVWIEEDVAKLDADGVVLVTQRLSNDALYRELTADPGALEREGVEAVFRAGDCVAPRLIADCVFDGHRLAREIDADDPGRPLPFIRERRLAGEVGDADYEAQLVRARDSVAV